MGEPSFCPFLKESCILGKCMLYDKLLNQCTFSGISYDLNIIRQKVRPDPEGLKR